MERVYSPDERIRRAEEIYARRQSLRERTKKATLNVGGEKSKSQARLKKLALQIIICVLIYSIFYLINTSNYSFSETVINKTKELLSSDIDFKGAYDKAVEGIKNFVSNQNNGRETEPQEEVEQEEIEQETETQSEEETLQEESQSAELTKEIAKVEIPEIIAPVTGTISSEFGQREVNASEITAYHKGVDIAVNAGTPVYSATDGEVIISKYSESYRQLHNATKRRNKNRICTL